VRGSGLDIYFSDYFQVAPEALERYGAFDISLLNDLPLFVDPFLLFNSNNPDYQRLHADIIEYMRFLRRVSLEGEVSAARRDLWFTFPEVSQNWLGYSEHGNAGHGLGRDFAAALDRNFRTVFADFGDEAVSRGSHIEKLCLIRDGVGRDNLSDFTANLIKGFLGDYTQAFARGHIAPGLLREFALPKAFFNYKTRSWATRAYTLPNHRGDFVLLTPKGILTRDETWINRSDLVHRFIGIADALPNASLRAQVNEYLLLVLPTDPKASQEAVNAAIGNVIERFPQVLDYYIRDREEDGERAVSAAKARVGTVERQFVEQVRALVSSGLEPAGFYRYSGNTYDEARQRLLFLKDVVENKGGHRFFYVDGEPVRRETDLHVLYRLTWYATPSDVSREVNDGRGPADFKVSRGAVDKTIVEFKLASNSKLEQNLAKQTAVYEAASDATQPSLKAVFVFSEGELKRVMEILTRLGIAASPHVVLIDARADNKPSGSRA
jgi:hypothetical protein